jgi:hypothetical protein
MIATAEFKVRKPQRLNMTTVSQHSSAVMTLDTPVIRIRSDSFMHIPQGFVPRMFPPHSSN